MNSETNDSTLHLCAVQTNLDQMLEFINNFAVNVGLSEQESYDVQLGCEEVLNNIIHYAYPHESGCIDITCTNNYISNRLVVTICDKGLAFNPLSIPEPDISTPFEDRRIGGLGIFLLRKMFDSIEYERIEDMNKLILFKK